MFGDLFEGLWTVEMLAAGHEPDFILLQVNHSNAPYCCDYSYKPGCSNLLTINMGVAMMKLLDNVRRDLFRRADLHCQPDGCGDVFDHHSGFDRRFSRL